MVLSLDTQSSVARYTVQWIILDYCRRDDGSLRDTHTSGQHWFAGAIGPLKFPDHLYVIS